MKTVSFHTLGCRLNLSETGSIADGFVSRGYEIVEFGKPSDVTFLNTCTVTDGADSSCRNLIRKARKNSPEGQVVVAGCYAQMEADKIKQMKDVDLILGTSEKYKVFDYLDEESTTITKIEKNNDFWGASTTEADSHTRAFLKIQDGCNYICSFCIIPAARGRSRTISIADAKREAKRLVQSGFNEIVLTGVNIGEYESTSGHKLSDLVSEIVSVDGLKRLRFSSVEPNTISVDLLEILKQSGIYQDHFHIPLQSGDDLILKSMRRKYTTSQYLDVLTMVKEYFPESSIGADIILGYPDESKKSFEKTYEFVKKSDLTHFHVFPYSKRKGTTAARLSGHLQGHIKKERVKRMVKLGEDKLKKFAYNLIGSNQSVLFEREKNGYFEGYSSNYIKVLTKSDVDLSNKVMNVKIVESIGGKTFGVVEH